MDTSAKVSTDMGWLLLLFILVPATELALLIEVGARIGSLPTIGLILFTGTVGATLARREGLGVLRKIQAETTRGQIPTQALFDGVVILLAGALLITPGVLTDVLGFACLVPGFRQLVRAQVLRWVAHRVELGQASFSFGQGAPRGGDKAGPVIDISPESTGRD